MKTVTIPEGMNPFVVYSNGVKYVYSPGETVEVPDGVAIEIEEYRDAQNKKPGAVDAPFDDVVHIGAEAPTDDAVLWVDTDEEGGNVVTTEAPITTADNGKFLRVVDGKWVAVALETAEGASF